MSPPALRPAFSSAWLAPLAALLLAGSLVLGGCGGEDEASQAEPLRPVRTSRVTAVSGAQTRAFAGQTQAPRSSRLSFEVQGTVARRPVKVGQRVDAGTLVAELDATTYRLRVQEARAALMEARAAAQNAAADYERLRGLYAEDLVSRRRFDRAQTQRATSRARVQAAEQRLDLARDRLADTRLVAPEAGAVADVMVEAGENVQPGQPVAVLTSGNGLEVEIDVPEDLIGQIEEGDSARVALTAFSGEPLAARVTEVGVAPRASATAYPVVVRLADAPARLRPGMAARVAFAFDAEAPPARLATGEGLARVTLPPEAVGRDAQGTSFVFVVEPLPADSARLDAAVVRRRPVETGDLTPGGLVVRGDLAPGARVVTAGLAQLTDGQRVRVPQADTSGTSGRGGQPLARRGP